LPPNMFSPIDVIPNVDGLIRYVENKIRYQVEYNGWQCSWEFFELHSLHKAHNHVKEICQD